MSTRSAADEHAAAEVQRVRRELEAHAVLEPQVVLARRVAVVHEDAAVDEVLGELVRVRRPAAEHLRRGGVKGARRGRRSARASRRAAAGARADATTRGQAMAGHGPWSRAMTVNSC